MLENEFEADLSRSINDAGRSQQSTESAREEIASQSDVIPNRQKNAKPSTLNGIRKEVMTSDPYSRMTPSTTAPEPNINLSREELLKLLSVFEGELQARDEVIEILKSERPNNPGISDRYGLSRMPLQALQRDAASLDATEKDYVADKTAQDLQKIIQNQKESYRKIKQALLAAEHANQRLAAEITEEKKKHQDYMIKSDDFVNLLEEERERLKLALQKEKEISESKEVETNRKLKTNKEELAKLKSLSLVLVEERQQQVSELYEHKKQITDLERRLKEAEIKWKESEVDISTEKEHAMQLENDLEVQTDKFFQTQEEFNTKLQEEREKNVRLEEKVTSLTQQLKKLQSVQRNLQKTDDQLWRIHEKLEQEDEEHELLLEEVELLRQRVKDMEEGEKIYIQAQEDCKDIKQKLEDEITLTRNLRSQLTRLQTQAKAHKDLQRSIEDADFRFDELQLKFEFEKRKSNDMKEHLQKMKSRMTELDQYEKIIQESEEKMKKMKEKIILLTDKKKCSDDQVKFLIDKNHQLKNEAKMEKDKVTEITEKLIKESKKVLKIREELSQEKQKYSAEIIPLQEQLKDTGEKLKEVSSNRQSQAEEANDRLRRQVIMLKTRLDELEEESEAKRTKIPQLQKNQSVEILDVVKKLHETEQRCELLAQQLHTKTKLCEDLKRKVAQANHSNNNSKDLSMTDIATQTKNSDKTCTPTAPQTLGMRDCEDKSLSSTTSKVSETKIQLESTTQNSSLKPKAPSKPSWGPSSLTRSGKVASVGFRVPKSLKEDPSKVKAEETRKGNPSTETQVTIGATIKVTKDGKTGQPVIKTVVESEGDKLPASPTTKKSGKLQSSSSKLSEKTVGTDFIKPSVKGDTEIIETNEDNSTRGNRVPSTRLQNRGEERAQSRVPSSLTRSAKVAPIDTKLERTSKTQAALKATGNSNAALDGQKDELKTQKSSDGNSKGLKVTNQDSKIPKTNTSPRYFRTFQAQKDFSELQRKWAAKLGK